MSQARFCLDGVKKVQRPPRRIWVFCMLKRGLAADVSAREGGVVLQIFPAVGDLAALPHAAGSFGSAGPAPIPGALDKAALAAYGVSMARPAGPAAEPARAPEPG